MWTEAGSAWKKGSSSISGKGEAEARGPTNWCEQYTKPRKRDVTMMTRSSYHGNLVASNQLSDSPAAFSLHATGMKTGY